MFLILFCDTAFKIYNSLLPVAENILVMIIARCLNAKFFKTRLRYMIVLHRVKRKNKCIPIFVQMKFEMRDVEKEFESLNSTAATSHIVSCSSQK